MERETWDGEHSEYAYSQSGMDAYQDDDYGTAYKSSGRSSYSSDPSEPTTPNSTGRSLFAGIQDTFDMESVYGYNERLHQDATTTNSASYAGTATTADTDDTQFASSVVLSTPVAESKPYFHHPDSTYPNAYNAQKRYSSPNTSVYSAGDPSFFSGDVSDIEEFPPSSPNFVVWPEKSPPRQGSRPVEIQGGRRQRESKKKVHNIFNPMRFFPRSSGHSWLNSKSNHVPNHLASSAGIRLQAPGPPHGSAAMMWADPYYPRQREHRDRVGATTRYPLQTQYESYGHRRHREREWWCIWYCILPLLGFFVVIFVRIRFSSPCSGCCKLCPV